MPWWDKITQGFEATHPGVKIETNFVPFNQYLTDARRNGGGQFATGTLLRPRQGRESSVAPDLLSTARTSSTRLS